MNYGMKQILKKNEILHNKDCPYLVLQGDTEMSLEDMIAWGKRYRCCKRCQRIVLVHNGIEDITNCEVYYNFFDRHQVSIDTLRELFVVRNAMVLIADDFVEIKCGEDAWKIPLKQGKGKVYLLHNNYVRTYYGKREICGGYHEQRHSNRTVEGTLKYIMEYDYELFHGL